MKSSCTWRAGSATDVGLERAVNEDRILVDESRGIFLVVDGLGGHAAGELAAETAVEIIAKRLEDLEGDIEAKVRTSITDANNRIFSLAHENPDWYGMACVLTLAVAHADHVTVGHVGDSRLYLAWNGTLRKLTSDHSLIGEREEHGEIEEEDAMRHPRRNEIFRDVGSQFRDPDDPDFIQTKTFLFRDDAALLLCSDGLSDSLTAAEINAIMERYNGDPDATAQQLVEAANLAGGRDNVSVVLVAGPEFLGGDSDTLREARPRHATTRMRTGEKPLRRLVNRALWLLAGMVLGILIWGLVERALGQWRAPVRPAAPATQPKHIAADASDALGIIKALVAAQPGDTIDVPPGQYLGPVQLKDGVGVVSAVAGQAIILSDPAAPSEAGIAVVAKGLHAGRLEGVRITADQTHPLRTGILVDGSNIDIDGVEISGAVEAGVHITGKSPQPELLYNFIHSNSGPGVLIDTPSHARLIANRISDNGTTPGSLHPGVEIQPGAAPVLDNNTILRNGVAINGDSGRH